MTYVEAASADGVWTQVLRVPNAAPEQVRRALAGLARTWPVAAFLPGADADPVAEVVLYRDPSRTHGTPDLPECDAAVRRLAAATGWTPQPSQTLTGVLVGLGLREGYDATAPTHSPEEVADHLLAVSPSGWRCRTARLVSARLVGEAVRWYEETGVVVEAETWLSPAIKAAATHCAQDRYVVTDGADGRTYALQQRGRPGSGTGPELLERLTSQVLGGDTVLDDLTRQAQDPSNDPMAQLLPSDTPIAPNRPNRR
ncbi:hypothetical protein ACF1D2_29860 [Streptomyces bacillaris]|uniref:hypothetical protein n=1 Tax=Streptomyces bacillaris TaxID=68179 RepID=UPI0036F4D612